LIKNTNRENKEFMEIENHMFQGSFAVVGDGSYLWVNILTFLSW
jgi:hypothetical protein